ncbi:hypothetical protein RC52_06980 [Herbaspirillum rubrisubalbicans]|nr:hypothetical protein [Herbaspirillum rubrisubalbicans]
MKSSDARNNETLEAHIELEFCEVLAGRRVLQRIRQQQFADLRAVIAASDDALSAVHLPGIAGLAADAGGFLDGDDFNQMLVINCGHDDSLR